ncbi:hypothetical protein FIU89_02380 [Roseovarius sp. THAF27]|nr:hypothetical protein FIU89_02380 [Roseovarius sp. THAF27]
MLSGTNRKVFPHSVLVGLCRKMALAALFYREEDEMMRYLYERD